VRNMTSICSVYFWEGFSFPRLTWEPFLILRGVIRKVETESERVNFYAG